MSEFVPKLFSVIFQEGISKRQFWQDVLAGIAVGIIALPLSIAFAIASGVSPEKGVITAVVAGLLISLFGGSRVQIGGPTGAFIVVISGIVLKYGFDGLLVSTFLAGFILIALGLLKMGNILKYISHALIAGFTTGIALIIFSAQIKELLGLNFLASPHFVQLWQDILANLPATNLWALAIGLATIAVIVVANKLKLPGFLLAIILMSALVYYFKIPVETIYSKFGEFPTTLPAVQINLPDLQLIKTLLLPALSIALLGALESLLSAVVADGMIGSKHRSNQELVAQGLANIAVALFGGIPATGAIARTAANIKNGGRTPIAGIVHSLSLLLIILVAAPLAKMIPLACLSGVLIYVAWNMSCLPEFIGIIKINVYERTVLLTTFLLTVFADLSLAIIAGFVVSLFVLMKRMSEAIEILPIVEPQHDENLLDIPNNKIAVFEINGPLFFGSVSEFINIEKFIGVDYQIFILRMRYVPIIDLTGLKRLQEIAGTLKRSNIKLLISGANHEIRQKLFDFGIVERENLFDKFETAYASAKKRLE